MAERCAGEDLALGAVCVMRALTTNMDWARLKVYGEQSQPLIHKLSREEKKIQVLDMSSRAVLCQIANFDRYWIYLGFDNAMNTDFQ